MCDGVCVDLMNALTNCGTCRHSVGPNETCKEGSAVCADSTEQRMHLGRLFVASCSAALLIGCPSSSTQGNDAGSFTPGTDGGGTVAVSDAGGRDAGHALGAFDGGLWGTLTPAASPLTVTVAVQTDAGAIQAFGLDGGVMTVTNTVCIEEEWNLCRDEHIVQRIIPVQIMSDDPHGPLISQRYSISYKSPCSGVRTS